MGKTNKGRSGAAPVRLTFLGAAQTVTGSRFLLESDGYKALIDCGLSAHGDRSELLRWLESCRGGPSLVRIVHGEAESSRNFAQTLRREKSWNAAPAEFGETVEI